MRTGRGAAIGFLVAACVAALAVAPAGITAASPSPEPSAPPSEGPPERPPFEVWLDRPTPTDAEPGDKLDVGATLWDGLGSEIPRMGATIFLRIVPAEGAAAPAQTIARANWPGHYRGTVEVPEGGLGRLELGVTGTICENDVCRPDDWVFTMGGVGPPPDAPVTGLAEARISVGGDVVAGTPTDVTVALTPQGDWESFPAPAAIVVRARAPRGPNLATASLTLTAPSDLVYEGPITIPLDGDVVLEAAMDEDGGDGTRFGTSMIPVNVARGADGQPFGEPAGPGVATDDAPPPVVLVLLALIVVVGAGVILSGFRGSNR